MGKVFCWNDIDVLYVNLSFIFFFSFELLLHCPNSLCRYDYRFNPHTHQRTGKLLLFIVGSTRV